MRAVTDGRDDLARQALVRHGRHAEHAETLGLELAELDAALAHYRTLMSRL
jgi:phage shock protein A